MSTLESCVCQQIRTLVTSLNNKKQFKATESELHKLLDTFGTPAEKYLLGVLLLEINFKDQKAVNATRDMYKVQLLKQELANLSTRPAFLDYFSQVIPAGDVEEFFEDFVRTLHLALPVQLLLALSLSTSFIPNTSRVGLTILKQKLKEYFNFGRPQRIPTHALHALLSLLRTHPEFTKLTGEEAALMHESIRFLIDSNPLEQNPENNAFLPLLSLPPDTHNLPLGAKGGEIAMTLGEVLEDLGPICSSTPHSFREVLNEFPHVNEIEMAEAFIVLCNKSSEIADYETRVVASVLGAVQREDWQALSRELSDKKLNVGWNIEVMSHVLKETYSNINWSRVIELLDSPKFVVKNEQAFNLLTSLHHNITSKTFPLSHFFKPWRNPRGQVSFLTHAVYSSQPREIFNWLDSPNRAPIEDIVYQPDLAGIIEALSSLDLLKVLIELSVTEFFTIIRNLLLAEAKRFPDIMIIGLCMIKPARGKPLLEELYSFLMPTFISPQTTNPIVLQTIWKHNPNLILKGAVEFYEREPNTITLSHLLDLTQEIKDSLLTLANCDHHKFAVHFGLLASKRDFLHLDQWVKDRVRNGKDEFVKILISFIQNNVLRPAQTSDPTQMEAILERAQFTKESLVIIFENLIDPNLTDNVLNQETQADISQIYSALLNAIPELKPAEQDSSEIEEAANKYFQQLYSGEISIDGVIELMSKFKISNNSRENDIFSCMINNLFDEFRFFHKYPEKELKITGELYGSLIQAGLISGLTLVIALRQLLEALRRPVSKIYRFGWYALEKFKSKCFGWKKFTKELVGLATLRQEQPEFVALLEKNLSSMPDSEGEDLPPQKEPEERKKAPWAKVEAEFQPPTPPRVVTPEAPPAVSFSLESIIAESKAEKIDESIQDRIMFIINTTSQHNIEEKASELREILLIDEKHHLHWFANYLVVQRASQETNFHGLYMMLINKMDLRTVFHIVTKETYITIRKLLASPKLLEESERKVLKSLGSWIGSLTIARNKPILMKFLDVKELLVQAYEQGKLIAIIPFTCKIMEQSLHSIVFSATNPWVKAILSTLAEIKDKPELKVAICIEIEILFRNLKQNIDEMPRSSILENRDVRVKANDFAIKEVVEPPPPPEPLEIREQSTLTSLPNFVVISQRLLEHWPEDELKRIVALAVELAVREILQPIIARSVNIGLITTRELVLKDFALEKDHSRLQQASQWIVQCLSGSLALVASREPFRVSLVNHLNELLKSQTSLNSSVIKTIVEIVSHDNVELGSSLVAKTVISKALSDVEHDQYLQEAINRRRVAGDKFYDENAAMRVRMTTFLPDNLKPKPTGLTSEQFGVYRDFLNIIDRQPKRQSVSQASGNLPMNYMEMQRQEQESKPEILTAVQAIAKFEEDLEKLETIYSEKDSFDDFLVQEGIRSVSMRAVNSVSRAETIAACAQKLFKRMFVSDEFVRLYVEILNIIRNHHRRIVKDITSWLIFIDDTKKFNYSVTSALIRASLLNISELDKSISKVVMQENPMAVHFACMLLSDLLIKEKYIAHTEMDNTITALRNIRDRHPNNEELNRLLYEIQKSSVDQSYGKYETESQRSIIEARFAEWLSMTLDEPYINSEKVPGFVKNLDNQGLLNSDEQIDYFFRTLVEICVIRSTYEDRVNYDVIDSFAKLAHVIIALAKPTAKSRLLRQVLGTVKSVILEIATSENFNQRPYYRIILDILTESTQPSVTFPDPSLVLEMLLPIADVLHDLNPCKVPSFSFSWLELISNRFFLPKMLRTVNTTGERKPSAHWKRMHRLIMDLLQFINIHYAKPPLTEALKVYYQGVLRVLCVLMHDFPEFLCDYHHDFCDLIPEHCVQLRNLILSAYPNNKRPPDPFTPNLKVDTLPEMNQAPLVLSSYMEKLNHLSIKEDIDSYFETRNPACVKEICNKMRIPDLNSPQEKLNLKVINAAVLYIGVRALENPESQRESSDLLLSILMTLDNETRKFFVNAIANQLRYPNSHTQYFSCILLFLFENCNKLIIQEQISKVLIERIIPHRPHPWGVLITFIELVKNPKYEFFKKSFTRCTPEVQKLLEKMSKSFSQTISK
jgi:CCR4-NOT transcription complex subunit 1